MGTAISRGLAVLALGAAFAASCISAQTGDDRPRRAGQPADANAPAIVSVDFLRHPISAKVRQQLLKALEKMESGDHGDAIGQLSETLAKYPDSAAYVHSLLGIEYVRTGRFEVAVSSLEQAVLLLPHESMAHYNLGLALICAGDYDRAAHEVQRALELDPKNTEIQARLDKLLEHNRSGN